MVIGRLTKPMYNTNLDITLPNRILVVFRSVQEAGTMQNQIEVAEFGPALVILIEIFGSLPNATDWAAHTPIESDQWGSHCLITIPEGHTCVT